MIKTASLRTPSKINLFLKVVGKREDGYHNIETIFLPLNDIYDVIAVELNNNSAIAISCSNSGVPCDSRNLCYKAAKLYLEKASKSTGISIKIEKNIPITAGMGGGSSDAAAILLILQGIFKVLNQEELSKIALKIGADVPFFLNPISSVGYGVGDTLKPFEIKQNFIVVICAPQFPVSAAWAYKNIARPCECEHLDIGVLIPLLEGKDYASILPFVKNDLAQALYDKFPLLEFLKADLLNFGLDDAEITGSGPTVFAICRSDSNADYAILKMKEKYGDSIMLAKSKLLHKPNEIIYG